MTHIHIHIHTDIDTYTCHPHMDPCFAAATSRISVANELPARPSNNCGFPRAKTLRVEWLPTAVAKHRNGCSGYMFQLNSANCLCKNGFTLLHHSQDLFFSAQAFRDVSCNLNVWKMVMKTSVDMDSLIQFKWHLFFIWSKMIRNAQHVTENSMTLVGWVYVARMGTKTRRHFCVHDSYLGTCFFWTWKPGMKTNVHMICLHFHFNNRTFLQFCPRRAEWFLFYAAKLLSYTPFIVTFDDAICYTMCM